MMNKAAALDRCMTGNHTVSGKLDGEYTILLASDSQTGKRLWHELRIQEGSSWSVWFVITRPGLCQTLQTQSLAEAMRWYDKGQN